MLAATASMGRTIVLKALETVASSFKERTKALTGMAIYKESGCKKMGREGNLEGIRWDGGWFSDE